MLSVNRQDFESIIRKRKISQILQNLLVQNEGEPKRTVMIKEMQTNPVSRDFLHIDFYEVSMDRKIRVSVPVLPMGKSVGVELGGVLQLVRRELEVMCLPLNIPEALEVDVTNLDIGDSVHVEDIPHGEGVEIPADTNFTVVTVLSPKKEAEIEEAEEGEEEAEGAEEEATEEDAGAEE
jgi:large subunit ribosomal protein L25